MYMIQGATGVRPTFRISTPIGSKTNPSRTELYPASKAPRLFPAGYLVVVMTHGQIVPAVNDFPSIVDEKITKWDKIGSRSRWDSVSDPWRNMNVVPLSEIAA